jgi:hypothetical protein
MQSFSNRNYSSKPIEDLLKTDSKCVKYADTSKYQIEDYGSQSNLDIHCTGDTDNYLKQTYDDDDHSYYNHEYSEQSPQKKNMNAIDQPNGTNKYHQRQQYESEATLELMGTYRYQNLGSVSDRGAPEVQPEIHPSSKYFMKKKSRANMQMTADRNSSSHTPSRIELKSINEARDE